MSKIVNVCLGVGRGRGWGLTWILGTSGFRPQEYMVHFFVVHNDVVHS